MTLFAVASLHLDTVGLALEDLCRVLVPFLFVASSGVVLLRVWLGPIAGLVSARSTLNVEAFAFLSFVALLSLRRLERKVALAPPNYIHLARPSPAAPLQEIFHTAFLQHPDGGDGFFRPLGVLYYWSVSRWAGTKPDAWHFCGVCIHLANTLLAYLLLRRISGSVLAGFGGALLFAWHASHVEAVCWTAASFDLLAAFFCLLVLCLATALKKSIPRTAAIVLSSVLACLSKESAYCLPLLVAVAALFYEREQRRLVMVSSLWAGLACMAAFVYRIWFLRGIGGYRDTAGSPMVFDWHPASTAQALLLRIWALLFIPVNWSIEPLVWLRIALTVMLVCFALAVFASRAVESTPPRHLLASLAFTIAAALPVFPLLLVGADLTGARVLYLPSVGIGLLWSLILADSLRSRHNWILVASFASLLVFQLTALLQNEFVWAHQAELARQACVDVVYVLKHNPASHVYASDLPRVRKGVYFLGNGFSDCVEFEGGGKAAATRLVVGPPPQPMSANDLVLEWDEGIARLVRLN